MAIEDKISKKVVEDVATVFNKNISEINRETKLYDELDAKSLNFVSLMGLFEEQFEVMMSFAELQRAQTVGEIIDIVVRLRKG